MQGFGLVGAALVALMLGACNQSASPPQAAAPSATPSALRMPDGAGCAGEIARYRAVMANDLATGHVGRAVHDRIQGELGQAEGACAAGRDADVLRMVSTTKARYGYR